MEEVGQGQTQISLAAALWCCTALMSSNRRPYPAHPVGSWQPTGPALLLSHVRPVIQLGQRVGDRLPLGQRDVLDHEHRGFPHYFR
jgi:hypothetical protein